MKALAVACLLLMPVGAGAQTRLIGSETVGHFRTWDEAIQTGYVLGWRSHSEALSVRCQRVVTVGEWMAALKHDPRLNVTDPLSRAMFALEIRDGCRVEK